MATFEDIAIAWTREFNAITSSIHLKKLSMLFTHDAVWRDLLAVTWNIITVEGCDEINDMITNAIPVTRIGNFEIAGEKNCVEDEDPVFGKAIHALFTFDTKFGRGKWHMRLKQHGVDVKCISLLTALLELKGFEEAIGERRIGIENKFVRNRLTYLQQRMLVDATLGVLDQPYVLIVGGGQAGVALAARLRVLGVPTLVVDRHDAPGDSWRHRYASLRLHDPIYFNHLPYLPFPENWPLFPSKDQMANWIEMYSRVMGITFWGSSTVESASFDDDTQTWKVGIQRSGKKLTVACNELVFAVGISGNPNIPNFDGSSSFEGVQCHSSQFVDAANFCRHRCVVIGTGTSSFDICMSLCEQGAESVTMVQRSGASIVRSQTLVETLFEPYSEKSRMTGITTEDADICGAAIPLSKLQAFHIPLVQEMRRRDGVLLQRLENAGFLLDYGVDGSGAYLKFLSCAGGFYFDVGACDLICDGSIKVKSSVAISHINPKSVIFTDGSEIPADLIVYATGYLPVSTSLHSILPPSMVEKIGRVWGFGSSLCPDDPSPFEGELRNMWKPTPVPHLWFHGGNMQQNRFYSLFLAIQLKARYEKLVCDIYKKNGT